jgi:hypothetical protein
LGFWDDINPFKQRTEGDYAGVNQANYALPGAAGMTAQDQARMNTVAPQAGESSFRNGQAQLLDRLQHQMNGTDSLAAEQLRQQAGQNVAQQQGFAASARPGGAQLASLTAATNAGQINQGLAGQQAMAGIAERNAATNAYGQAIGQARGQDLQNSQFNAGANLQQQGINQGWGAQQLQNAGMQQQGSEAYEANRAGRAGAALGTPTWGEGVVKAGLGAASIAAMKDGGIVTQPTRALIGEAGPEAVIPLAKLPDMMRSLRPPMGGMAPAGDEWRRAQRIPPQAPQPQYRPGKMILPGEQAKSAPSEGLADKRVMQSASWLRSLLHPELDKKDQ